MKLILTIPLGAPKSWADVLPAFHRVTSDLVQRMGTSITSKSAPSVGDGAVVQVGGETLCIWSIQGD